MAYTATLKALSRVRDQWRISILYEDTDSGQSLAKDYRFDSITKAQLRGIARRDAAALLNNATSDVDIPVGTVIDVTPDPVVPPTPPTQAELDKAAWFADWRQLKQVLELTANVPALLTPQTQTLIDNLQTSLEAGWVNSYLDGI